MPQGKKRAVKEIQAMAIMGLIGAIMVQAAVTVKGLSGRVRIASPFCISCSGPAANLVLLISTITGRVHPMVLLSRGGIFLVDVAKNKIRPERLPSNSIGLSVILVLLTIVLLDYFLKQVGRKNVPQWSNLLLNGLPICVVVVRLVIFIVALLK